MIQKRIPLSQLIKTDDFSRLTPSQKMFVATYIENDYNHTHAIRTAYKCKNDNSAKVMSYNVMRSFNVMMVLSLHFGDRPVDIFVKRLDRAIRTGQISRAKIDAYRLLADVKGYRRSRRLGKKPKPNQKVKRKAIVKAKAKGEPSKYNLQDFETTVEK